MTEIIAPRELRILIVDDEPLAVERLQILCSRQEAVQVVGTAHNGEAALRLIAALAPDVVLLDIAMPGMDGMAVAHALSSHAPRQAIIFVTAFDRFAVAAFDVAATDYLLKPVTADRLRLAFTRVRGELGSARPAIAKQDRGLTEFWVPHGAEIIRIAVSEIDLIEAERDYMRLHIGQRSFLLHETISELERRLDPDKFLRLHRSSMVPRDRVVKLRHDGAGNWQALLKDGRAMRIGRTYLAKTRSLILAS